ncbi:UPF0481 protein At3g47200-like [Momordica charantia]|uniref:UPF0481 protein At3g47200-like n=1 Tax=Momordica charantia TaxID=3673 RepID=A0A6J1BQ21_MOMCH|nr:UPF0481 protein At3g47200-like [Momordica charantia]
MELDKIGNVPAALFEMKPEAYIPQFIFIGHPDPTVEHFVSGNNDKIMKGCFVGKFSSVAKVELNEIIGRVIGWEQTARDCYLFIGRRKLDTVQFVKFLVMDGCFVVMYMLVSVFPEFQDIDTSSFFWRFNDAVFRDLLLFQNQLPFFLLRSLYDLCVSNNQTILGNTSFIQLTHQFFIDREGIGYLGKDFRVEEDKLEVKHLIHFLSCYMNFPHQDDSSKSLDGTPLMVSVWPPTATELYDYGISFEKKSHYSQKMFDERTGILRVPHIIINETFESTMRNIIAYEYTIRKSPGVSNFLMFMRFLLNSDNDVNLLIKEGIIHNHLESAKEVTKLFQDLCKNVVAERNLYNYECQKMRKYCKHRRHRWMASLKHDYFNTPWALISFIAAVVLLLLTLMRAVVAVLSMPKPK